MSFSSLFFLFVFLPISLVVYFLCPARFRKIPLVLISLIFFAWGEPVYLILLLISLAFNYVSALEIAAFRTQEKQTAARVAMIVAVAANLLLLGYFKYLGFLISNLSLLPGVHLAAPRLTQPLGLSFYTFTVLSYVLDVYKGKAEPQRNVLNYLVYATFFPKFMSGPIVLYREMETQLSEEKRVVPSRLGAGWNLFLVGLFKKLLLSDNLGSVFAALSGSGAMSVGTAWLGVLLYGFQLYFDFSGYSDMAIGLAKMLGYDFDRNFDYPYRSASIAEFWRRWHISLGNWFREYVYIPMGGNRCTVRRQILNLLVVWLLTGLWHGADWSFVLWGLWHGAFIILERFVLKDRLEILPRVVRVVLACLVVFFGWTLFFSDTLPDAMRYYGQMFGAGHLGFFDGTFFYYFRSSAVLLAASVIGSGPLLHRLHQRLVYWRGGAVKGVSVAAYVILLVLCVAIMVSSTYTSFLYFQF